nr:glycosyltransferase family 39 protein [Lachnospiraceae bacterium]
MNDKKSRIFKITGSVAVAALALLSLFLLNCKVGISNQMKEINPPLFDSPSYVEPGDGGLLKVEMKAYEDVTLDSFRAVMVNTESNGKGIISFSLCDDSGELWTTDVEESAVSVGEWYQIGTPQTFFEKGKTYTLKISPSDCDPYFIKTQLYATNRVLPFEESVIAADADGNEKVLDHGISLGTGIVSDKPVTFGSTFYYSYLIVIAFAVILILIIISGPETVLKKTGAFWENGVVFRFGNEILLVLFFITFCLSIYVNGYLEGINISADSAGYLREAVNMAAGNGFHYDALAGYDNTWFANWPILYPALIALFMKITGAEVYLASKILSMVLVGILLLVLRLEYGKKAWIYALCATNLGLMYLYWYSWSELPFIIFILLFALFLSKIVNREEVRMRDLAALGCFIVLAFLTRYFGMFLFGVCGFYIMVLLVRKFISLRKEAAGKIRLLALFDKKITGLIVTCAVSGVICLLYLINNKIRNGMPSGVSRSMWWDDYATLTNDLIKALIAEIFNVFHTEVPSYIASLKPRAGAAFVIIVVILLAVYVIRNTKFFSRSATLIMTSVIYYGMFIIIRYFSSMDTFYYRFFAPATFLFTLGLIEIIAGKVTKENVLKAAGSFMAFFLVIISASYLSDHISENSLSYYDIITMNWDEDYSEIPQKSVVIFSNLDFRSLYY